MNRKRESKKEENYYSDYFKIRLDLIIEKETEKFREIKDCNYCRSKCLKPVWFENGKIIRRCVLEKERI